MALTDPRDASALLDELHRVQRRAFGRLPGSWFPMTLFGGLSLLSIPVVAAYGVGWHGLYWGLAGPLGSLLTVYFYVWSGRRIGLEVPSRPHLVAVAVIVSGASLAGMVGGITDRPMVSVAGPPLAVCVGLLLFARLTRSGALATIAGGLAAVDAGLVWSGVEVVVAAIVLSLIFGLASLWVGLRAWDRERR